jgi:menaquinone-dependent protoporphyrinogen oxidase
MQSRHGKEKIMRIAIIYATREGQTRRIVEYLAGAFLARDVRVELFNAKDRPELDFAIYDACVVAASVHIGNHEREIVRFVRENREALERIPTAFLSVSMSQAGVGDLGRTEEQRDQAAKNVAGVLRTFFQKTGWHPRWTRPVAGALAYTKYNFLVRWVMKSISKREGGNVDTTCDHEYTDWAALEHFAGRIVGELEHPKTLLTEAPPAI